MCRSSSYYGTVIRHLPDAEAGKATPRPARGERQIRDRFSIRVPVRFVVSFWRTAGPIRLSRNLNGPAAPLGRLGRDWTPRPCSRVATINAFRKPQTGAREGEDRLFTTSYLGRQGWKRAEKAAADRFSRQWAPETHQEPTGGSLFLQLFFRQVYLLYEVVCAIQVALAPASPPLLCWA